MLGARLISVTGMLQNENGVIHIVAEHIEDLSRPADRLSKDTALVDTTARADMRQASDGLRRPPAPGIPVDGDALVIALKEKPALPDSHSRDDRRIPQPSCPRVGISIEASMPGRHRGEPCGIVGQAVAAPGDMQVGPQQQEVVAVDRARPGIGDVEHA